MDKVLALDIGEKRIGLANSDALGMLAHPFATLQWQGLDALIKALEKIIREERIATIVVGMPYTLKGGNSKKTEEIKKISAQLKERLKVPVFEQDERLTTKMAVDALQAVGKKPSKQRNKIDQIAAVYILQSYLDRI